jgi:NAD(P)-dependent dehydrogenase (short-subunit alcohol dehydrogenase family)
MKHRGGGHIVNISSRGAYRGEPLQPAYGASKAGLNSLTQSMALLLGRYGISVNAVAPGFTDTERVENIVKGPREHEIAGQSPFNRIATPEEVAAAVLYLASEEAIFTSGTILDLNGASYFR